MALAQNGSWKWIAGPVARFGAALFIGGCAALAAPRAEAQFGWGGFGNYASTAGQAADYGMSAMMRAQGQQNLSNSEAANNWEDAKTKDIQNRLRWTETYFEMRKTNREARAAEAGPPITQDQAIRNAKSRTAPRLASTQLDPVTGHIEYPMLLTQESFAEYRDRLDSLFAQRAATGGSIQYSEYQEIQVTVNQFIEALKSRVADFPAREYGQARVFLDSLAREARLPAG